jgi:hypothetical protein
MLVKKRLVLAAGLAATLFAAGSANAFWGPFSPWNWGNNGWGPGWGNGWGGPWYGPGYGYGYPGYWGGYPGYYGGYPSAYGAVPYGGYGYPGYYGYGYSAPSAPAGSDSSQ